MPPFEYQREYNKDGHAVFPMPAFPEVVDTNAYRQKQWEEFYNKREFVAFKLKQEGSAPMWLKQLNNLALVQCLRPFLPPGGHELQPTDYTPWVEWYEVMIRGNIKIKFLDVKITSTTTIEELTEYFKILGLATPRRNARPGSIQWYAIKHILNTLKNKYSQLRLGNVLFFLNMVERDLGYAKVLAEDDPLNMSHIFLNNNNAILLYAKYPNLLVPENGMTSRPPPNIFHQGGKRNKKTNRHKRKIRKHKSRRHRK